MAARAARLRGTRLTAAALPEWLTEPVVYIAFRWYRQNRGSLTMFVPDTLVTACVRSGTRCDGVGGVVTRRDIDTRK